MDGAARSNVRPHREHLESSLAPKEAADAVPTLRDSTILATEEEAS